MNDFAETVETSIGPLKVVSGSSMATVLKKHPRHDPGVEFFMLEHRDRLFPFFDVGANAGFFSVLAGRLGGPVVAVEADEQNAALLRENAAGLPVTVLPVACAAEDGEIEMGTMPCGRSAKAQDARIVVPARSLRSIAAELGLVPSFIKLDIEGGETDALLGLEGPELASAILEIEFSWRDHGSRLNEWLRICPVENYRWEFLLGAPGSLSNAVPLILDERQFFRAAADDERSLAAIMEDLKLSTAERASRKWELCITPR